MRYRFLRFPGGKPKAFTMSYDDGVRQDIRLAEICCKYGVKCTFNLNSGLIHPEPGHRRLCADEIREHLLGAGHEIAVHGFNHQAPGAARPIDTMQEVLKDRLGLEKEFGGIIRGMAYPDSGITKIHPGTSYETIRLILQDLGIVYSRSLAGDNDRFLLPEDWYNWVPTAHHNNPQVLEFAEKFVAFNYEKLYSANRHPRLFYLWGHSYEFDNNDNWDRIEAILEIVSGKDDTWYPTNIQLREYVAAYESLVYSADGMRVYNPTLTEVWFNVGGMDCSVKPGEMITMG
jgi:peptidoglycan/xylan/chitin deacetylase (PgdA/CDA1 family)